MERMLGVIERGGNKMPNPAILFVYLCVGVILLSQVLSWADVNVTYQVVKPPPVAVQETLLRRLDAAVRRSSGRVESSRATTRSSRRRRRSRAC